MDGRGVDGWVSGGQAGCLLGCREMSLLMSQKLLCFSTPCGPASPLPPGGIFSKTNTPRPESLLGLRLSILPHRLHVLPH